MHPELLPLLLMNVDLIGLIEERLVRLYYAHSYMTTTTLADPVATILSTRRLLRWH